MGSRCWRTNVSRVRGQNWPCRDACYPRNAEDPIKDKMKGPPIPSSESSLQRERFHAFWGALARFTVDATGSHCQYHPHEKTGISGSGDLALGNDSSSRWRRRAGGRRRASLQYPGLWRKERWFGQCDGSVRAAIQAAKLAGGGTVFVPPGEYVTGPIELVSNLVLNIEAGATLQFPATRLPLAKGRVQGIECLQPVPLLGGMNVENVTITGGCGHDEQCRMDQAHGRPQGVAGGAFGHLEALRTGLEQKTPASEEEYVKAAPYLRPAFTDSWKARMCSSKVFTWWVHLLDHPHALLGECGHRGRYSRDISGAFTGGIYIDSSRDVRIANCYRRYRDDAIVSSRGRMRRTAGQPADRERVITIASCTTGRRSRAGQRDVGRYPQCRGEQHRLQGTQMGINIRVTADVAG